jgi:uncharacterized protein (TIGR02145 family)
MPNSIQLKNINGEDIFPVVINEGLQSINKQVTIPTGSTVASVTLDNDKYNIIDTIDSNATELDINFPKSLTKVQECDFEFGVGADSSLETVKAFVTGRQIPVKAPSAFDSTKMYQGTSLNNAIIITEFDVYPIIITNIEATNDTSSSIDIVVTGTMGSDPLPNNLEYTLSLSLDGVITNIDAIGSTTTLTGTQYTAYSNASEVNVAMIIVNKNYGEFILKGNFLVLGDRAYKVVQIGNQLWIAENLDWVFSGLTLSTSESPITPSNSDTTPIAWYYNNDESTYKTKCGLLYNYYAAEQIESLVGDGWHLPTANDITELQNFVKSENPVSQGSPPIGHLLKAVDNSVDNNWPTSWGAVDNNKYGFSALPTGKMRADGVFEHFNVAGYHWTSFDGLWVPANKRIIQFNKEDAVGYTNTYDLAKYGATSVRLVKNLT